MFTVSRGFTVLLALALIALFFVLVMLHNLFEIAGNEVQRHTHFSLTNS